MELLDLSRVNQRTSVLATFGRIFSWQGRLGLVTLVLLTATVVYFGFRQSHPAAPIRTDATDNSVRVVLDLERFSSSRAPEEGGQSSETALTLLRRRTDLVLSLPIGSDQGAYRVSLKLANQSLWTATIVTTLIDYKVSLETIADFSDIPAGQYTLSIESSTGTQILVPVEMQNPKSAKGRSTSERVYSVLLNTGLVARNWFSANHHHLSLPARDPDATQLLVEADHYAFLGNLAVAGPIYARAEERFKQQHDARGEIHARVGHIRSIAERMPFEQVSSMLEEQLEKPVVQSNPELKLWCLAAKGYTDLDVDPASARRMWEQARIVAKNLGERAWEGRANGELGIISFLEGDGATAKKLVGNAFFTAVMTGDVGAQVRYFSMFGNGLNELKRYDEALEYFNRALTLADSTPDIGFPFMAYEGKAEALVALGRSGEADLLLNHALEESRKLDRRGHEAQLYVVLGKTARVRGDTHTAIKYLQSAAELSRNFQFYRTDADAMFELSSIYHGENNLRLAEECLLEGISASRKIGDRFYLPRDLAALAEIKDRQRKTREADSLYDEATDVLDGLLVNSASPDAKSSIVGAMSDIYVRHFALMARMRNTSKAFLVVERARGRAVADLLRTSSQRSAETHHTEQSDREITNLQIRLLNSVLIEERKRILAELFDAEQKRALAIGTQAAPATTHPVELSDLRRVLHSDELLLEYVVGGSDSYCLAITRLHAALIHIDVGRDTLERIVQSYLVAIRAKENTAAEERQLYSILFTPIEGIQKKLRLIVVPDGSLNLLPFDCLRAPDGKYALYSHIVSHVPSSTVFYILRATHRKSKPSLPFLGIGDVTYVSSRQPPENGASESSPGARGVYDLAGAKFSKLPGTRQEIVAAGRLFGSKSVLLTGPAASEAAFKDEPLSTFRVIHLAVHGVAVPKYPERAALVLGNDPANREDGLLQVREITSLRLNADLVTLSACDTGTGRLEGEEGVESIERSFLIAGARTVVATLWSADDTLTAVLIEAFYAHLAAGDDKGAALRNAKLEVIRRFGYLTPPYYWAGFTINGDAVSAISTSIQ